MTPQKAKRKGPHLSIRLACLAVVLLTKAGSTTDSIQASRDELSDMLFTLTALR